MKIFCQQCGIDLKEGVVICPKCGFENKVAKKNKGRYIFATILVVCLLGIASFSLLYKYNKIKIPTVVDDTVSKYLGKKEYDGKDLIANSLSQRTEGAKNLEAWIKDSRDNKTYRIVKMPDNKWWMAENLNYQKGLTLNERADNVNGSNFIKPKDGTGAIGSYWCNDSVREWTRYDYENFDTYDYETQQDLIKTYGRKPASLAEVDSGYPGSKGSNNDLKRIEACSNYGALYTWETAVLQDGKGSWNGTQLDNYLKTNNICPLGWKLPTDSEWATLLNSVESETNGTINHESLVEDGFAGQNAGKLLKTKDISIDTTNYNGHVWYDGSKNKFIVAYDPEKANPEIYFNYDFYGFSIFPTGAKKEGLFLSRSFSALFWTSTQTDESKAVYRSFDNDDPRVYRGKHPKSFGLSVRCVQDNSN